MKSRIGNYSVSLFAGGKYFGVYLPHHPDACSNGYVYEHRLVAANIFHRGIDVYSVDGVYFAVENVCKWCGKKLCDKTKTGLCQQCYIVYRKNRIRPDKLTLINELGLMSYTAVGRKYGVSGNAVKKWAKSYGIYESKN